MAKPNNPNFSLWQRAKFNIALSRPRPIKRWKDTDAQVKNLFVGAAVAAPGFLAMFGGASQAYNNQSVARECANRPTATALGPEICKTATDAKREGILISTIGGTEMLIAGGATVLNHRRLSRNGADQPNPSRSSQLPSRTLR